MVTMGDQFQTDIWRFFESALSLPRFYLTCLVKNSELFEGKQCKCSNGKPCNGRLHCDQLICFSNFEKFPVEIQTNNNCLALMVNLPPGKLRQQSFYLKSKLDLSINLSLRLITNFFLPNRPFHQPIYLTPLRKSDTRLLTWTSFSGLFEMLVGNALKLKIDKHV